MTAHPADQPGFDDLGEPGQAARLLWIRKRDGSVVEFDPARLAASIYNACEEAELDDAAFVAQELSQAVLHFLAEQHGGLVPATREIQETVETVLRELGQGPVAAAYHDYSNRRARWRQEMRVIEDPANVPASARSEPPGADPPRPNSRPEQRGWDKTHLIRSLEFDIDLPAVTARELAAHVERTLLRCEIEQASTDLIRELVNAELQRRGFRKSLRRRRYLGLTVAHLEHAWRHADRPAAVHEAIAQTVLRQFSLQEVYSADVSALHEEGLLRLYDLAWPAHWAAVSVDTLRLAAKTGDLDRFLAALEAELLRLADGVSRSLGIAWLDGVLAILAEGAPAAQVAQRVSALARQVGRQASPRIEISVHGWVRPEVCLGLSDGPLFQLEVSAEQHRWAADFSEALLRQFQEHPDLVAAAGLQVHFAASTGGAENAGWSEEFAPMAAAVRWVADRGSGLSLVDGLSWRGEVRTAVSSYVGIDLAAVLERVGDPADVETFGHRLLTLAEAATRAGVQKREFLRRPPALFARSSGRFESQLVVVPIGLDEAMRRILGHRLGEQEAAAALASQLLTRLLRRLRREARPYRLAVTLDGLPEPNGWGHDRPKTPAGGTAELPYAADSTAWAGLTAVPGLPIPPMQTRLDAASRLHALARGGTAVYPLRAGQPGPTHSRELRRYFLAHSRLHRLHFLPTAAAPPVAQLSLADDWK